MATMDNGLAKAKFEASWRQWLAWEKFGEKE
jgi:hypothetical protein